jgi:hypothetical protein
MVAEAARTELTAFTVIWDLPENGKSTLESTKTLRTAQ